MYVTVPPPRWTRALALTVERFCDLFTNPWQAGWVWRIGRDRASGGLLYLNVDDGAPRAYLTNARYEPPNLVFTGRCSPARFMAALGELRQARATWRPAAA